MKPLRLTFPTADAALQFCETTSRDNPGLRFHYPEPQIATSGDQVWEVLITGCEIDGSIRIEI